MVQGGPLNIVLYGHHTQPRTSAVLVQKCITIYPVRLV